jgi:hypothetical protein
MGQMVEAMGADIPLAPENVHNLDELVFFFNFFKMAQLILIIYNRMQCRPL